MAISVSDLDELLGYDPTTHSVAGIPTMAAKPAAGLPALQPTDAQLVTAGANERPVMKPFPSAAAAAPAAPEITPMGSPPPALPGAAALPTLAAPTRAESNAAGRAEFQAGLPKVTAEPFTPEYYQQQQELADYQKIHPWGSPVSAHPGILGKIGHGLAAIGNVAGDVLAPGVMQNVPGTERNKELEQNQRMKGFTTATENELKEQQTAASKTAEEATKAGNEPTPWTPLGSTTPIMVPFKSVPTLEAAEQRAQGVETAAATKNAPALAKLGYKQADDGTLQPIPDDQLSPAAKQARDLTQSVMALNDAKAAVERSKNDPNSPEFKLAQQRLDFAAANAQRMAEAMGLHEQEFQNKVQEQGLVKPSGQTVSRSDAAGAALELLPNLEEQIKANAADMGPLWGRIKAGEIKIGNVDPDTQKLYSAMQSFYAMQPAIHGFRNAEFVKDFDSFIGSLKTNPDAVIAGLEGLKPTLEAVERSGRTYKQRIVEGGGANTGAPAGGGGGTKSVAEWQADRKKQQSGNP